PRTFPLSLHDALPILAARARWFAEPSHEQSWQGRSGKCVPPFRFIINVWSACQHQIFDPDHTSSSPTTRPTSSRPCACCSRRTRSEEHTSELQSQSNL